MAWIYFQVSEESQSHSKSGSSQSPIAKVKGTRLVFFCRVCKKVNFLLLPFGTMCEHSKVQDSMDLWTSYMEDSHDRISALRELEKAWKESAADYFTRSSDLLMKYDRSSSSWKMSLLFGQEAPTRLSENWPACGMMLGGSLYRLAMLGRTTNGKDGGFWPTPCGANNGGKNGKTKLKRMLWRTPLGMDVEKSGHGNLLHQVKYWPTPRLAAEVGGQLNPTWVEWLMGYPTEWTKLNVLAMRWF